MDKELKNLRREIDEIDKEIIDLIENRVEIAKKTGEVKRERGLGITDSKREESVLENVSSRTELDKEFMKKLFKSIIDYCKNEECK
ncbi:MAG: chorismate mutase [Candidatus Altiarchaeota archaeon]|nr:chorismate mutase [Candidatus Altiarchaeota archaeon]